VRKNKGGKAGKSGEEELGVMRGMAKALAPETTAEKLEHYKHTYSQLLDRVRGLEVDFHDSAKSLLQAEQTIVNLRESYATLEKERNELLANPVDKVKRDAQQKLDVAYQIVRELAEFSKGVALCELMDNPSQNASYNEALRIITNHVIHAKQVCIPVLVAL
jgi:hypothetical protein